MKIRVQMPPINEPRRQKNARVVVAANQAEADALIAQGGKLLEDEAEPAKKTAAK